jgi:hypothetical protein
LSAAAITHWKINTGAWNYESCLRILLKCAMPKINKSGPRNRNVMEIQLWISLVVKIKTITNQFWFYAQKASGPLYVSPLFIINWGYGFFMVWQFPAETSMGFVAVCVTRPMQ